MGIIILGLLVERFFYAKEMNRQLEKAILSVMSRNINEYLTAITVPKNHKEIKGEPEDIDLSEADDKTFDSAIKIM